MAEHWGHKTNRELLHRVLGDRFLASRCHSLVRSHIVHLDVVVAIPVRWNPSAKYFVDVLGSSSQMSRRIRGVEYGREMLGVQRSDRDFVSW